MRPRSTASSWLALVANVFLALSLLAGGVRVAYSLLQPPSQPMLLAPAATAAADGTAFGLALRVLGALTLLWSLPLWLLSGLTPRLPLRLLLPPILVAWWVAFGAHPLPALLAGSAELAAGLIQLGVSLGVLALSRLWLGRWWLAGEPLERRPGFSWRRTLGFGAAQLLLPPLLLGYLLVSVASTIHLGTAGFVSFDGVGVKLAERRYQRDDRQIWLVGMMHIGESESYEQLFASFARESTLVLEEGVSDEQGLLQQQLDYGNMAGKLGLSVQPPVGFELEQLHDTLVLSPDADAGEWPHVLNADVDVSEFSGDTLALLDGVARVWASDSLQQQLSELMALASDPRAEAWTHSFMFDVVELRNQRLLGVVREQLPNYETLVIPWGGLHLPEIERTIQGWGFERGQVRHRRLVRYSTVLAALAAQMGAKPRPEPRQD